MQLYKLSTIYNQNTPIAISLSLILDTNTTDYFRKTCFAGNQFDKTEKSDFETLSKKIQHFFLQTSDRIAANS